MIKLCHSCDKILEDGDVVSVEVVTVYHQIPSKNTFAVEQEMALVPDTLRHHNCQYVRGIYDGD